MMRDKNKSDKMMTDKNEEETMRNENESDEMMTNKNKNERNDERCK